MARLVARARLPPALRHKTYPLAVILDGITLYNLGHTLAEAAAKLKSRHGHAIAASTLAGWIEHRDLAIYARSAIRGGGLRSHAQDLPARSFHREQAGLSDGRRFYRPRASPREE
jgi:hypothetical protein